MFKLPDAKFSLSAKMLNKAYLSFQNDIKYDNHLVINKCKDLIGPKVYLEKLNTQSVG